MSNIAILQASFRLKDSKRRYQIIDKIPIQISEEARKFNWTGKDNNSKQTKKTTTSKQLTEECKKPVQRGGVWGEQGGTSIGCEEIRVDSGWF